MPKRKHWLAFAVAGAVVGSAWLPGPAPTPEEAAAARYVAENQRCGMFFTGLAMLAIPAVAALPLLAVAVWPAAKMAKDATAADRRPCRD